MSLPSDRPTSPRGIAREIAALATRVHELAEQARMSGRYELEVALDRVSYTLAEMAAHVDAC